MYGWTNGLSALYIKIDADDLIFYREPRITAGEICGAVVGVGCGKWEEINNWTVDIPDNNEPRHSTDPTVEQNDDNEIMRLLDNCSVLLLYIPFIMLIFSKSSAHNRYSSGSHLHSWE